MYYKAWARLATAYDVSTTFPSGLFRSGVNNDRRAFVLATNVTSLLIKRERDTKRSSLLSFATGLFRAVIVHDSSSTILITLQALREYLPSSLAWQRALDTLPTENLTPTQEQQREEYQKRLYESTDRLHHKASGGDRSMDTRYYRDGDGQQPWEVAREMIPALEASGNTSSSVRSMFLFY